MKLDSLFDSGLFEAMMSARAFLAQGVPTLSNFIPVLVKIVPHALTTKNILTSKAKCTGFSDTIVWRKVFKY